MKKEMTLETNDEAVDLSRRSMMGRLGLVASVAIAAPVLMTMSTSALARHVGQGKNNNCGKANYKARENRSRAAAEKCDDWGPATSDNDNDNDSASDNNTGW